MQVGHYKCELSLRLHEVVVGGHGLVSNVLAPGLNGDVGLLDECLECGLCAAFLPDCLSVVIAKMPDD